MHLLGPYVFAWFLCGSVALKCHVDQLSAVEKSLQDFKWFNSNLKKEQDSTQMYLEKVQDLQDKFSALKLVELFDSLKHVFIAASVLPTCAVLSTASHQKKKKIATGLKESKNSSN